MIIHLGNHSLHMVRTSGTTDQMVDLLAQMSSSVMYLHPIMDMVLQLMGKADKDLAPRLLAWFSFLKKKKLLCVSSIANCVCSDMFNSCAGEASVWSLEFLDQELEVGTREHANYTTMKCTVVVPFMLFCRIDKQSLVAK